MLAIPVTAENHKAFGSASKRDLFQQILVTLDFGHKGIPQNLLIIVLQAHNLSLSFTANSPARLTFRAYYSRGEPTMIEEKAPQCAVSVFRP